MERSFAGSAQPWAVFEHRDEADVLISEANHRISNNLTLLAASIRNEAEQIAAQAESLDREGVVDMVRGIAGRIAAAGQMHRELAQNPGEVDLNAHLASICRKLIAWTAPGRFRLHHITAEPCPFATDKLMHLCLIVPKPMAASVHGRSWRLRAVSGLRRQ